MISIQILMKKQTSVFIQSNFCCVIVVVVLLYFTYSVLYFTLLYFTLLIKPGQLPLVLCSQEFPLSK